MKMQNVRVQSGFTMMELVVVMVMLGILAATVIPNVVDMSAPARLNTLRGIGAQITAAAETNYSLRAGGGTGYVTGISACSNAIVNSLLQTATALPSTYTVNGGATGTTLGAVFTCGMYDSEITSGPGSSGAPINLNLVASP